MVCVTGHLVEMTGHLVLTIGHLVGTAGDLVTCAMVDAPVANSRPTTRFMTVSLRRVYVILVLRLCTI